MYKLFLSTILASSVAFATQTTPKIHCTLSQEGSVSINWKAYKTPAKLGVGGLFD